MANQSGRGFAGMDDDKQRDIAKKGGESVPDEKRSFSQDRELASEAGRKGREASHGGQQAAGNQGRGQQQGGGFHNDPQRASGAGKKGGQQQQGR